MSCFVLSLNNQNYLKVCNWKLVQLQYVLENMKVMYIMSFVTKVKCIKMHCCNLKIFRISQIRVPIVYFGDIKLLYVLTYVILPLPLYHCLSLELPSSSPCGNTMIGFVLVCILENDHTKCCIQWETLWCRRP